MEKTSNEEIEKTANEMKNQYLRDYRKKNRKRLNEYYKNYRKLHKEEIKEANQRYWRNKAIAQLTK